MSFFLVDELRRHITHVTRYDSNDAIDCSTTTQINNRFFIIILHQQIFGSILRLTHQLLILRLSGIDGGHHLNVVIMALLFRRRV